MQTFVPWIFCDVGPYRAQIDFTSEDGAIALDLTNVVSVLVDHAGHRVGCGTSVPRRPGAPCACYIAIAS